MRRFESVHAREFKKSALIRASSVSGANSALLERIARLLARQAAREVIAGPRSHGLGTKTRHPRLTGQKMGVDPMTIRSTQPTAASLK